MNLRDLIILALAVVGLYLLFSLLRLAQIKLRMQWLRRIKDRKEPVAHALELGFPFGESAPRSQGQGGKQTTKADTSVDHASASFEAQLFRTSIESEIQQLRNEVASLKESLVQLKASRRVSPQYSEAMLLAQRGMDVQRIAEQCAISVGEAELVQALSRNSSSLDDSDNEYERFERDDRDEQAEAFGQGGAFGR